MLFNPRFGGHNFGAMLALILTARLSLNRIFRYPLISTRLGESTFHLQGVPTKVVDQIDLVLKCVRALGTVILNNIVGTIIFILGRRRFDNLLQEPIPALVYQLDFMRHPQVSIPDSSVQEDYWTEATMKVIVMRAFRALVVAPYAIAHVRAYSLDFRRRRHLIPPNKKLVYKVVVSHRRRMLGRVPAYSRHVCADVIVEAFRRAVFPSQTPGTRGHIRYRPGTNCTQ